MRVRSIVFALGLLLMSGCVTPTVTQKSFNTLDFSRFKTVAYSVHTTTATQFDADSTYGKDVIDLFDALLGKKLSRMGYVVVTNEAAPI
jgi:uncharacterized lipoprotein YajG